MASLATGKNVRVYVCVSVSERGERGGREKDRERNGEMR